MEGERGIEGLGMEMEFHHPFPEMHLGNQVFTKTGQSN